jgi:NAD-dependent deacetylase
MSSVKQLARFLDHAECVVAFTGAGISTESGIPDFRSPGGVWSRTAPVMYDDFVSSREARIRYWKQRVEMYRDFANANPNAGHRALAELEQRGKLKAVITQNIDGLHQLAGSTRVIEIHGTARVVACIACGKEWTPEVVHAMVEGGDCAPDCDECGAPLKSRTISFGQAMPENEMLESAQLARSAGLFLAIGSSLVVEPAASLPRTAKHHGATLVIINREGTPLDSIADLVIRNSIGETLAAATTFKED